MHKNAEKFSRQIHFQPGSDGPFTDSLPQIPFPMVNSTVVQNSP